MKELTRREIQKKFLPGTVMVCIENFEGLHLMNLVIGWVHCAPEVLQRGMPAKNHMAVVLTSEQKILHVNWKYFRKFQTMQEWYDWLRKYVA